MSALQCIYIDAQGGEVVRLDLMRLICHVFSLTARFPRTKVIRIVLV